MIVSRTVVYIEDILRSRRQIRTQRTKGPLSQIVALGGLLKNSAMAAAILWLYGDVGFTEIPRHLFITPEWRGAVACG